MMMKRTLLRLLLSAVLCAGLFSGIPLQTHAAGTTVYGGVDYAAVYDFDFYVGQHADLFAAYGNNPSGAIWHFVNFGMKEGRQASAAFNADVYKERYADLYRAFGENKRSYYYHYINHGIAENRSGAGGAIQQPVQEHVQEPAQEPVQEPVYEEENAPSSDGGSEQARAKLEEIGYDLFAAYNWSKSLVWTDQYASPDAGTRAMANTGFTTGTGGCYVMAATFYEMARELGYEAYQMSGFVPRRTGGMAIHSWVEVVIDGDICVVDPDYAYETGGNGYLIHYGDPGTWRYQDYYRMN